MKKEHARRAAGFTLVELLAAMAIGALLLAAGVPSFRGFVQSRTANAQVAELASSIKLARTEAIKRGARISLCLSEDGATCTTDGSRRDWSRGWLVFQDSGVRGVVEPGDDVLRAQPVLAGGGGIIAGGSTGSAYTLSFLPSGVAPGATNYFSFRDAGGAAVRRLCVTSTGLARATSGAAC